jgi:hypothetical protein
MCVCMYMCVYVCVMCVCVCVWRPVDGWVGDRCTKELKNKDRVNRPTHPIQHSFLSFSHTYFKGQIVGHLVHDEREEVVARPGERVCQEEEEGPGRAAQHDGGDELLLSFEGGVVRGFRCGVRRMSIIIMCACPTRLTASI